MPFFFIYLFFIRCTLKKNSLPSPPGTYIEMPWLWVTSEPWAHQQPTTYVYISTHLSLSNFMWLLSLNSHKNIRGQLHIRIVQTSKSHCYLANRLYGSPCMMGIVSDWPNPDYIHFFYGEFRWDVFLLVQNTMKQNLGISRFILFKVPCNQ